MNKAYNSIEKYIYSKNYLVFIIRSCIIFFVISLLINIIITDVFNLYFSDDTSISSLKKYPFFVYFILGGVILPIFETVIFQWLPLFIFSLIGKRSFIQEFIFCVLVAIIFGLVHSYTVGYIISASCMGFLYLCYGLFLQRRNMNFFLPIFIVHSFNNIISLVIDYISKSL